MSDVNPDWSPSGRQIVFESNRTTGADNPTGDIEIFVMNADGMGQKNLTRNTLTDRDPAISPDGRRIAFERDDPTDSFSDIFRMRADGTRKSNLTES